MEYIFKTCMTILLAAGLFLSVAHLCFAKAEPAFTPTLTVVTFCGRPLYVSGISEEGSFLMGSMDFLQNNKSAWALFAHILSQLPLRDDGEPMTRTYDVEHNVDVVCPRPA